jgi:predicted NACHT family NTPase
MPRASPGPANQKRAWSLIEALVLAKVGSEAQAVVAGVELEYLNWKPGSKSAPQIRGKAQLTELSKLTKSKLNGEQIREIISLYLGEKFLGILEDKRHIKHGKGAENWHFILTLWSTDLEENRKKFNWAWERRKSGETEEPVSLDFLESSKKNPDNGSDIDELVQEVRSRACEKIKTLHGTMRMLRVNHRVPVDDIYIDLNVLEQVSCDRTFSDWRKDFQRDSCNFDRLGLGQVIGEGVPALDMVRKYPKLMVFGKPGSGKTTFLKSLALQCIEPEGQLQWERQGYVPIFITLQKFAKDARKRGKFSLFDYIYHREFCSWGEKNQQVVEAVLDQGKALVLLDGLDEVQGQEYKRVIEEVESFCEYFHSNRFLITCRTQNQRYKFEGFTDVEVADFKPEQVNRFIKRWFAVVADNAESEKLALELTGQLQQLENKQIAELAVTPVLLNLICCVFQGERGKLPKNRADLYKKGLRDLLEGLDESKGVQREPIYEKLTPEAKEDLLAYLAVTLFEANDYFPQQETLENLIIEHFQISRSKANKLLRSLEEQSGLLVERSEGFWSFSHLTFQEYFTAKWFCDRADYQGLAKYVKYKHWQEVFLLVVEILKCADELLQRMKDTIDSLCCPELLIDHNLGQALDNAHVFIHIPPLVRDLDYFYVNRSLLLNFENIFKCKREHKLQGRLQELRAMLPEFIWANCENFKCWWQEDGQNWTQQLIKLMSQYRNIKNDWQFNEAQKELLRQYYQATNLLRSCLNSGCAVSDEVRKEIEETLLFSVAGIE